MKYFKLAGRLIICAAILILAANCSGPEDSYDSSDTGSVSFTVQWPDEEGGKSPAEADSGSDNSASQEKGFLSATTQQSID